MANLNQMRIGRQTINFRSLTSTENDILDADIEYNMFGYADNIVRKMILDRKDRIKELVGHLAQDLSGTYTGLDSEGSELTLACLEPYHIADGTNFGTNWRQTSAGVVWETHNFSGSPGNITTVTVREKFGHVFFGMADFAGTGFVDCAMIRPSNKIDRRIRMAELVALTPNNEGIPVMPIKTYMFVKGETYDFRILPNTNGANLNFGIFGVTCGPSDRLEREVFTGSLV